MKVLPTAETFTVRLVKAFRVAWWCRLCWARGELLVPRGMEPYRIQGMADNAHYWLLRDCPELAVRVEFDTRREVKIPESQALDIWADYWQVRT